MSHLRPRLIPVSLLQVQAKSHAALMYFSRRATGAPPLMQARKLKMSREDAPCQCLFTYSRLMSATLQSPFMTVITILAGLVLGAFFLPDITKVAVMFMSSAVMVFMLVLLVVPRGLYTKILIKSRTFRKNFKLFQITPFSSISLSSTDIAKSA